MFQSNSSHECQYFHICKYHECQKILFVIPILQDQDYDLDKTYLNQIANLKFIIKSSKSISRFHNMSYGI